MQHFTSLPRFIFFLKRKNWFLLVPSFTTLLLSCFCLFCLLLVSFPTHQSLAFSDKQSAQPKHWVSNTKAESDIMSFFPANPALPVSHTDSKQGEGGGLRRRLSSMSLKIQLQGNTTRPRPVWSFPIPRSKSLSSMGDYAGTSIRKWWDWGRAWILSRKSIFARDLEMNEQETNTVIGSQSHNKGSSWRHVFYKVRSEIRRLLGSDHVGLPQTFRYGSLDYSKNFDG